MPRRVLSINDPLLKFIATTRYVGTRCPERERETDTQTDRHIDRHTDTQTHRHTDTQTQRQRDRDKERQRQTDRETERQRDRSDKGDFVGRDNGPISLVLGTKKGLRPFNGCREMYIGPNAKVR